MRVEEILYSCLCRLEKFSTVCYYHYFINIFYSLAPYGIETLLPLTCCSEQCLAYQFPEHFMPCAVTALGRGRLEDRSQKKGLHRSLTWWNGVDPLEKPGTGKQGLHRAFGAVILVVSLLGC